MTAALPDAELARLKELLEKATPGEWSIDTINNDGEYGNNGPDTRSGFKSHCIFNEAGESILDTLNAECGQIEEDVSENGLYAWDETSKRNLELIAAMKNALPSLLAEVERGRKDAELLTRILSLAYRSSELEPPYWVIPEMGGLGETPYAAIDAALTAASKEVG